MDQLLIGYVFGIPLVWFGLGVAIGSTERPHENAMLHAFVLGLIWPFTGLVFAGALIGGIFQARTKGRRPQ